MPHIKYCQQYQNNNFTYGYFYFDRIIFLESISCPATMRE